MCMLAFFDKTENAVGDLTTRLADDRYATRHITINICICKSVKYLLHDNIL